MSATAARSKEHVQDDAPSQVRMRPPAHLARNPDTDQKKIRRQQQRKTGAAETEEASPMHTEADLLAAMAQASLPEQRRLMAELDEIRRRRTAALAADRETDLAASYIADVMTPVPVHTPHTAATDWIAEVADEGQDLDAVSKHMLAEASLWFGRTSMEVKADRHEFSEQARGIARRIASGCGSLAPEAERAFLDYVAFLHRRTAEQEGWPLDAPGQQQADTAEWDERQTTGDTRDLGQLPQVSSARSLDDEFAFVAADADKSSYPAHEQAGYAESGLPDEPTPGDEEPFDAKVNDGDAVLDPTGPVGVHPPMPGAGESSNSVSPIEEERRAAASLGVFDMLEPPPGITSEAMRYRTMLEYWAPDDGPAVVAANAARAAVQAATTPYPGYVAESGIWTGDVDILDVSGVAPMSAQSFQSLEHDPRRILSTNLPDAQKAPLFARAGMAVTCNSCGHRWNSGAEGGPERCPSCSSSDLRRLSSGQSGNAESALPNVEVGDPDDRPMWPWELPIQPGDGAANVAGVPSPDNGYPQPRQSAREQFVARVQAGLAARR